MQQGADMSYAALATLPCGGGGGDLAGLERLACQPALPPWPFSACEQPVLCIEGVHTPERQLITIVERHGDRPPAAGHGSE